METKEITLYDVSELTEDAQKEAYTDWLQYADYPFAKDNEDVLYEFSEYFPVNIKDYRYDEISANVSFSFDEDNEILQLSGIRLLAYLQNNYFYPLFKGKYYSLFSRIDENPHRNKNVGKLKQRHSKVMFERNCLTGYYLGEIILDPIHEFMKKPDYRTFEDLLEECIHEWENAVKQDVKGYFSFESFKDHAEANDYKYTKEGKLLNL